MKSVARMMTVMVVVLSGVVAAMSMGVATAGAAPVQTSRRVPAPVPAPVRVPAPVPVPGPSPDPSTASNVRNVCDQVVAPGEHRCFALERTDVKQPSVFSPNVGPNGFSPADLKSAYALPAGTTNATVAVVDAFDYVGAEADLAVYREQFGLPPCTTANGCFTKVDQNGNTPNPATMAHDAGWATETALDIDMVSAICPTCKILLVESFSPMNDLFVGVSRAVALGAKFVSMSWGGPQSPFDSSVYDPTYFNALGVAYVAASGDVGYPGGVEYPSASPNVISVGGTHLAKTSATARGWTESAWGASNPPDGTGSGCSTNVHAKPSWQPDTGCAYRAVNDVSAVADTQTPVAIFGPTGWLTVGGTSVSAPIIAAVYALVGSPPSRRDNPASSLYANASNLNDVTTGNNGSCAPALLCTAGPGWDGPTGLGTPNGLAAFQRSGGVDIPWTIRRNTTGDIEEFATANDQQVYHRYMVNGTFTAWSSLGGLPGGGAVSSSQVSWGSNYLGNPELYVTGVDGNVYHDFATPGQGSGWSGWSALSQPDVGSNSDVQVGRNYLNNQEMFIVGKDANVYHRFSTPGQGSGWSGWDSLGGPAGTTVRFGVHVGRNDTNNQELYVVGTNGTLYHNFATPGRGSGWNGWDVMASVPGVGFRSDVNVGLNFLGNQELYFVGTDNQVYHNFATPGRGSGWSSFSSLGSPSAAPLEGYIDLEAFDYRIIGFQDLLVYDQGGRVFENDSTPGQGSGWSGWH